MSSTSRPDPIARHARVRPSAPALVGPSETWTYAALDASLTRLGGRLRALGVAAGDRVGVHCAPTTDTVRLLWALWRNGAVAVPLSLRLPAGEVGPTAARVGCTALVTEDAEAAEAAPGSMAVHAAEALRHTTPEGPARAARPPDRPATIVYTSGSTGTPKAALHTWANHFYSAKGANANMPLRPGDRWLLSLPLYHVGGLAVLVRCALAGAAVVVPAPSAPLHEALRRSAATYVSLVATQFGRLLDATTGAPPPSLRGVLLGGGPIPRPLLRRGDARGWPLHTSYGCTEMASQVTTTAPGARPASLATAGRRLPHRRLRIRDGEIQVAGPPLFQGYVTEDGLHTPQTDDGWYATGDRGRIDASGRLHVLGRVDRMFVSGGENIQPEEIETALERLDGVERAVVVPVPDPEYGARPVAFVEGDAAGSPAALRAALERRLPGFKIPDAFHSLPASSAAGSLKIDREELRRRARDLRR